VTLVAREYEPRLRVDRARAVGGTTSPPVIAPSRWTRSVDRQSAVSSYGAAGSGSCSAGLPATQHGLGPAAATEASATATRSATGADVEASLPFLLS
jgi:hypothetical protein